MSVLENYNPIVKLPFHSDERGTITFVEDNFFKIKRVFFIKDVPLQKTRASHAHKNMTELIIPLNGSFEVYLYDGKIDKKYLLDNPSTGILIKPNIWIEVNNFKKNSICLVLASESHSKTKYIKKKSDLI